MNFAHKYLLSRHLTESQKIMFFKRDYLFFKGEKKTEDEMLFRFISVSDIHYGLDSTRAGLVGTYDERMQLVVDNLIREKQENGLDFFIGNGDIVHRQSDDFADSKEMLIHVKNNYLDPLNIPYYVIPGNHDWLTNQEWENLLGYRRSTSFESGDFGFILLDSSDAQGARQICVDKDYLEQKLIDYSSKKGVFFITHIPRFKGGYLEGPSDSPQCDPILDLLDNAGNVILSSHGHFHYEDDLERHYNDIPILFNSHVSNYGTDYWGYRIFEVYEDKVVTKLYNMSDERVENTHTISF